MLFLTFSRLFAYSISQCKWRDTRLYGAVTVMMDRSRKGRYIQIYNGDDNAPELDMIFECEIYYNFSHSIDFLKVNETNIVSFVYHKRHFGLEFPSESCAKDFISSIKSVEETCSNKALDDMLSKYFGIQIVMSVFDIELIRV